MPILAYQTLPPRIIEFYDGPKIHLFDLPLYLIRRTTRLLNTAKVCSWYQTVIRILTLSLCGWLPALRRWVIYDWCRTNFFGRNRFTSVKRSRLIPRGSLYWIIIPTAKNPNADMVVIHLIILPLPTGQFAYPYAFNRNHLGSLNIVVSMKLVVCRSSRYGAAKNFFLSHRNIQR